ADRADHLGDDQHDHCAPLHLFVVRGQPVEVLAGCGGGAIHHVVLSSSGKESASSTIRNLASPARRRSTADCASVSATRSIQGRTPLTAANLIASSISCGLPVKCPAMLWAFITSCATENSSVEESTPRSTTRPRGRSPRMRSLKGGGAGIVVIMRSAPPSSESASPGATASVLRK